MGGEGTGWAFGKKTSRSVTNELGEICSIREGPATGRGRSENSGPWGKKEKKDAGQSKPDEMSGGGRDKAWASFRSAEKNEPVREQRGQHLKLLEICLNANQEISRGGRIF